jgi:hypothetical protein
MRSSAIDYARICIQASEKSPETKMVQRLFPDCPIDFIEQVVRAVFNLTHHLTDYDDERTVYNTPFPHIDEIKEWLRYNRTDLNREITGPSGTVTKYILAADFSHEELKYIGDIVSVLEYLWSRNDDLRLMAMEKDMLYEELCEMEHERDALKTLLKGLRMHIDFLEERFSCDKTEDLAEILFGKETELNRKLIKEYETEIKEFLTFAKYDRRGTADAYNPKERSEVLHYPGDWEKEEYNVEYGGDCEEDEQENQNTCDLFSYDLFRDGLSGDAENYHNIADDGADDGANAEDDAYADANDDADNDDDDEEDGDDDENFGPVCSDVEVYVRNRHERNIDIKTADSN